MGGDIGIFKGSERELYKYINHYSVVTNASKYGKMVCLVANVFFGHSRTSFYVPYIITVVHNYFSSSISLTTATTFKYALYHIAEHKGGLTTHLPLATWIKFQGTIVGVVDFHIQRIVLRSNASPARYHKEVQGQRVTS